MNYLIDLILIIIISLFTLIGYKKGLVNINTATVQELTTLTGIGESRALAIIAYREENGLFQSIDGIKKVAGIKDGLFEKIKNQITI